MNYTTQQWKKKKLSETRLAQVASTGTAELQMQGVMCDRIPVLLFVNFFP